MRRLAIVAAVVAALVTTACGPSEREIALDLEERVVDAVGTAPTSREYLERNANAVNDVADTVLLVWVGVDLGDAPGVTIDTALREAGLDVVRVPTEPVERDPRDGSWSARIAACDPDGDRAGLQGTLGTSENGELVLLLEVGGPPATSGCRD